MASGNLLPPAIKDHRAASPFERLIRAGAPMIVGQPEAIRTSIRYGFVSTGKQSPSRLFVPDPPFGNQSHPTTVYNSLDESLLNAPTPL
jgi:hypothetical protein